jgi:hypothetical protein
MRNSLDGYNPPLYYKYIGLATNMGFRWIKLVNEKMIPQHIGL